jgi:hypothetical protein
MPIGLGDGTGIEVLLRTLDAPVRRQDAAVDHDVGDMNPLRAEFPGH